LDGSFCARLYCKYHTQTGPEVLANLLA
jgi:hypothetical protein